MALNPLQINRLARGLKTAVALACLVLPLAARAELYIYIGPDGERMITDRPPVTDDYKLLARRDTFDNAGHILANRPIDTGGNKAFRHHIHTASEKYKVDPALVEAIIQVESSFRPDAVSRSGATGLMQLMPGTARDLKVTDRYNPRQNIHGGVLYISQLMERFNNNLTLVLAAYNAGPGAVERHGGIPPRAETERYVKKVMAAYHEFRMLRYGAE
ncbi:MAG: lytic transglycosylase domain-containing protein [Proteobacteria bacterium]|nr:lytic transglycosylase domain-containing protein [Pseudomonadota bacterium]